MVFYSWWKILSFLAGILISTTFCFALPTVIGIDLDTTHSSVGVYTTSGHVEIIPNDQGNRTTPSWVAFTDTEVLIGDSAKNQATLNPERTIFDVRRFIGREFDDPEVQRCIQTLPYKIVNKDGKPYIEVEVKDGEAKVFSPEEITAMVLQKMKEMAESYLGKTVKDTVITVPSYFGYKQRQAIGEACRISGLNVARTFHEPMAAALSYGLDKKAREMNVLVFDLGADTLDVTVVGVDNRAFEILGTNGGTHSGGEEFDHRVINYFVELIKKRHNKDISEDKEALVKLRKECERVKWALNFNKPVRVAIESLYDGIDFSETLTRAWLEELNMDLFEKTMSQVKKALEDAKLKKSDIDEIVLVGESARIPKVQQLVKDFFDGKEPLKGINPEEVIAFGATLYGATLPRAILSGAVVEEDNFGYGDPRRHGVPWSLSIETAGVMTEMIPQYQFFPTKKSKIITTSEDQQTKMEIKVFEGENKYCWEHGSFELSGIAPAPKGVPQIKVTFEVDSNNVFIVTAEDKASRNKNSLRLPSTLRSHPSVNEFEQMTKDREEEDRNREKKMKEGIDSRNKLENYIHSVQSTIRDKSKLADKIDSWYKENIELALNVALEWLRINWEVEKDDFDDKTWELEDFCKPVIEKAYEASSKISTHLKDEEVKDEL